MLSYEKNSCLRLLHKALRLIGPKVGARSPIPKIGERVSVAPLQA
jgi:hypothetical protein